jgi:hypothetical protein
MMGNIFMVAGVAGVAEIQGGIVRFVRVPLLISLGTP